MNPAIKMPCPRLQLTWEPYGKDGYNLICTYKLILPCTDGRVDPGKTTVEYTLGTTRADYLRGTPVEQDGTMATPFREGVHIRRDAHVMRLRAFVVWQNTIQELTPIEWEGQEK